MCREQIIAWAERGLEFGAHTRTHPDLRDCGNASIEQEIAGSRSDLEQLLGKSVVSFAYPFGQHDERVRSHVQRSFPAAFTCDAGMNDRQTDLLALRRMIVGPERPSLNHLFRLYGGRNAPRLAELIRKRLKGGRP
jgi:hypothetical protein